MPWAPDLQNNNNPTQKCVPPMKPALLFLLLVLSACRWTAQPESGRHAKAQGAEPSAPNVIIVFTDDQGYADLEPFGGANLRTPNLNRLADQGVRLTDFYVAQPVCSASRAALLTGAYPNRVGVSGAFMPDTGRGLALEETTLAEMLKARGYTTALMGKWHLGDDPALMPNRQGFDEFFGIAHSNDMWPYHPLQGDVFNFTDLLLFENETPLRALEDQSDLTRLLTDRSIAFIEANKQRPFFLYLAHPQPHVPLFVSGAFQGKTGAGLYADVIGEIDHSVGRLMAALERYQLADNTLLIFTSDNGPWLAYGDHAGSAAPLREGKGTVFEGGVRVPFIARFPGRIRAGSEVNVPLMSIDLLPTIAGITDSPLPERKIDGKDAWSVLTGASDHPPHEAYYFYYGDNELRAVRYGKWKLYYPHSYPSLNGREGGAAGLPARYETLELTQIALYDLQRDPSETRNLAAQHPQVVARIEALAQRQREALGDGLRGQAGRERRPLGRAPD